MYVYVRMCVYICTLYIHTCLYKSPSVPTTGTYMHAYIHTYIHMQSSHRRTRTSAPMAGQALRRWWVCCKIYLKLAGKWIIRPWVREAQCFIRRAGLPTTPRFRAPSAVQAQGSYIHTYIHIHTQVYRNRYIRARTHTMFDQAYVCVQSAAWLWCRVCMYVCIYVCV